MSGPRRLAPAGNRLPSADAPWRGRAPSPDSTSDEIAVVDGSSKSSAVGFAGSSKSTPAGSSSWSMTVRLWLSVDSGSNAVGRSSLRSSGVVACGA